jgi:hypothetical protein
MMNGIWHMADGGSQESRVVYAIAAAPSCHRPYAMSDMLAVGAG